MASFTFEVGRSSGRCGGFTPSYSCLGSTLWTDNRDALLNGAEQADSPYLS